MFFFLSKFLAFFIRPFNIIMLLLLSSALIRHATWKKRLRWASLALFLFFSNGFIFNEILTLWEKPPILIADLEDRYDLAVVLGGTTDALREPKDRLFFHKGADRLTHAINLYKAGKVDKILFTGGNAALFEDPNRDNSPIYNFYLMCGVDSLDILIESSSRNTRENALMVKEMVDNNNRNGKVILVTSAFHMRRAEGCFKKVGIEVTGFSTDFYSLIPKNRFKPSVFMPSSEVLGAWAFLIKEWIGYIVYDIMDYL